MAVGINIKLYNGIILNDSIQFSTLLTNSQILKFSNSQILKFSNSQILKFSNSLAPSTFLLSNYKLETETSEPMTNFQSMTKAPQGPLPNYPKSGASETHFPIAGNNPSIFLVTRLEQSKGACVYLQNADSNEALDFSWNYA
jgi:hypothetical protein